MHEHPHGVKGALSIIIPGPEQGVPPRGLSFLPRTVWEETEKTELEWRSESRLRPSVACFGVRVLVREPRGEAGVKPGARRRRAGAVPAVGTRDRNVHPCHGWPSVLLRGTPPDSCALSNSLSAVLCGGPRSPEKPMGSEMLPLCQRKRAGSHG